MNTEEKHLLICDYCLLCEITVELTPFVRYLFRIAIKSTLLLSFGMSNGINTLVSISLCNSGIVNTLLYRSYDLCNSF